MKTLRSRLILSHILPMLIIIPALGFVLIYLVETQILLTNLSNELTRQASILATLAGQDSQIWSDPSRAQQFVTSISPSVKAQVMLLDASGHILSSSDPQDTSRIGQGYDIPNDLWDATTSKPVVFTDPSHPDEIKEVLVPVVSPFRGLVGFIRLLNPLTNISERFSSLRQLTLIVLGVGLLAGVLLGWLLAANLERPLRRTTQAVYQLSVGEHMTPLPVQGPVEVRMLLQAFNALVERLSTMETNRRQLLANLVHELGRPLGALQSAVQALCGGADEDVDLRKQLLDGMDDEIKRLRHLLDDLARLHDQVVGTLELNFHPIVLEEWLPRVLAPWRQSAQEKGLEWETHIPSDLPAIQADPDRLAQALENLLSNAIRYTPVGGKIVIEAIHEDGRVKFQVADTGPGISAEEESRIFTPFFRGKAARRFDDGMGLGLSIARDLVTAHGGRLSLESTPGKGSCFTIDVPITRA